MFYIFGLPQTWFPFTFGKPVPRDLVPPCEEECYLAARVLPVGYLNLVGIAQHLHRNFIRNVHGSPQSFPDGSEVRRDRAWSLANPSRRVYLDSLDLLKKEAELLEGVHSLEMSPLVAAPHPHGSSYRMTDTVEGNEVHDQTVYCHTIHLFILLHPK